MGHYTVISTTPGTLPGGAPYAYGEHVDRDDVDHLVERGVLQPADPPADTPDTPEVVAHHHDAEPAAAPTPPARPRRRHPSAKD